MSTGPGGGQGPIHPGARLALRALLDHLGAAVIIATDDERIRFANAASHRLFGAEPGELSGQPVSTLVPERLRAIHHAGFRRFLETGRGSLVGGPPIQVAAVTRHGSEIAVEVSLDAVMAPADDGGVERLVIATLRTVTERIPLEQQLAITQYLRASIDVAVSLQGVAGVEEGYAAVLPALCTHLDWDVAGLWRPGPEPGRLQRTDGWLAPGVSAEALEELSEPSSVASGEELPGRCFAAAVPIVVPALDELPESPRRRAALAGGMQSGLAFPLLGGRGVLGVIELYTRARRASPELVDVADSLGRQLGQFLDRMRAESEVSYRAALLSSQLEAVDDAVLIVSKERSVVDYNQRFVDLWPLPAGMMHKGAPVPGLMLECRKHIQDIERFDALVRRSAEDPTARLRLSVELRDGRVLAGYSAPVLDDTGRFHGRVWYVRDDTERLAAERERARLLAAEQSARREAESAHAGLEFLAHASDVLSATLDLDGVVRSVAELAVPFLADWCVVYLHDNGVLRRVGAAHADPAYAAVAAEILSTGPMSAEAATPAAEAFRKGEPILTGDFEAPYVPPPEYDDAYLAIAREFGGRVALSVPLRIRGRTWGLLSLVRSRTATVPSDMLALAEEFGRRAASAIENATLYEREHSVATALQRAVLPERLPTVPGVDLTARYLTAVTTMEAGGDWYDAFLLPDGRLGLAVGDVAGHGIRAASVMGQLRNALRAYALDGYPPAEVMIRLDRLLAITFDDVYATAIHVTLDPGTGELRWVSAGHPPALVWDGSAARFLTRHPELLLGTGETVYTEHTGTLAPGGSLWIYSDGLVEARGETIEAGLARLRRTVEELGASAAPAPDEVVAAVLADRRREDDVCLLVAQRTEGGVAAQA